MAETKLYTVAIGNFKGPFASPRRMLEEKRLIEEIKKLDGFYGVYPSPPNGTLLLFETENNAKGARNILRSLGVNCGRNIGMVYANVPKEEK